MGRYCLVMLCLLAAGCPVGSSDSQASREWRRKTAQDRLKRATGTPVVANVPPASAAASAASSQSGGMAHATVRVSGGRRFLVVNDETITTDDILRPIRTDLQAAARNMSRDRYYETLRSAVMRQLIREMSERMVYKEACRDWNDERRKQLDTVIDRVERDRINQEFGGRRPRFEAWLESEHITRADFRARMGRALVVREYLRDQLMPRATVNRRDLLKYYNEHPQEFRKPGKVEMFLIDIPFRQMLETRELRDPDKLAAARRVARQKLEEARAKIASGQTFEEVARQYSKGLNVEHGGRWGVITEPLQGYWEHPSKTALKLKSGEVSPVVEFDQGVYLVKAGRVEPVRMISFETAQKELTDRLREIRLSQLEGEYLQNLAGHAAMGEVEPFVQAVIAAAPEAGAPEH